MTPTSCLSPVCAGTGPTGVGGSGLPGLSVSELPAAEGYPRCPRGQLPAGLQGAAPGPAACGPQEDAWGR
jgi:hypothetical protein